SSPPRAGPTRFPSSGRTPRSGARGSRPSSLPPTSSSPPPRPPTSRARSCPSRAERGSDAGITKQLAQESGALRGAARRRREQGEGRPDLERHGTRRRLRGGATRREGRELRGSDGAGTEEARQGAGPGGLLG